MEYEIIEKGKRRLGGSHDRFARKYLQHTAIVSDLLQFYADPIVSEYVDVNALQPLPRTWTTYFSTFKMQIWTNRSSGILSKQLRRTAQETPL